MKIRLGLAISYIFNAVTLIVLGILVQNLRADRDWMQRDINSLYQAMEYTQTQLAK